MIKHKKNSSVKLIVTTAAITLLLTACSSTNHQEGKLVTTSNATSATTYTSSLIETTAKSTSSNNIPVSLLVSKKTTNITSTKATNVAKDLLADIKKSAKNGKVIKCDYIADGSTNIDDIIAKWGKADKEGEWIAKAQGLYTTFSKHNLVFGSNKGGAVFEIRSFDKKLNNISLSQLKKSYGKPAHDVKANGQEIIGYTAGSDYKLLFVFPQPTKTNKNPKLDHYSVLHPRGTLNIMSGEPEREW